MIDTQCYRTTMYNETLKGYIIVIDEVAMKLQTGLWEQIRQNQGFRNKNLPKKPCTTKEVPSHPH